MAKGVGLMDSTTKKIRIIGDSYWVGFNGANYFEETIEEFFSRKNLVEGLEMDEDGDELVFFSVGDSPTDEPYYEMNVMRRV